MKGKGGSSESVGWGRMEWTEGPRGRDPRQKQELARPRRGNSPGQDGHRADQACRVGAADHPPSRPEVLDNHPGSSHPHWVLSASFLHTLKTSPWLFLATPLPAAPGWALSHSAGQGLQDPHTLVPVSSSWPSEGVCTAWVLRPREQGSWTPRDQTPGTGQSAGSPPKADTDPSRPGG